jgi:hypothetical protein
MKTALAIVGLSLAAWNITLMLKLRDISAATQRLRVESETNLILARNLDAKAKALAVQARRIARNTTVILLRGGK